MTHFTYARFLDIIRAQAAFYEELVRCHAIQPRLECGELKLDIDRSQLSSPVQQWLMTQELDSARDAIDLWLRAEIAAHGPKVFRPTLEQCLAMEQIAPHIPLADYVQPYPVMIVEFAEDYQRVRGCAVRSNPAVRSTPECVVIGFHPQPVSTIWADVVFGTSDRICLAVLPTDSTIEAGIVREFGDDSYVPLDASDIPDRLAVAGVLRVAVNAMLLLTEFRWRRAGPANPSHYTRLQRHLERAQKRGQGLENARRNLRLAPQVIDFAQDIVLYTHARTGLRESEAAGDDDTAHRRPHWRRGHWKMHAHGPARSLRKKIFIPPTLVNRDLLRGHQSASPVTYSVR